MGTKGGRLSGKKLGYSQVVNPMYLLKKGTMTRRQAAEQIFRNMISNMIYSLYPEPYIDRGGRVAGNLIGAFDLMRGLRDPERAVSIEDRVWR